MEITPDDFPPVVKYDERDHHDPQGGLFVRNVRVSLEGLAEGRKDVNWYRAYATNPNSQENYVRVYKGDVIDHYLRLDVYASMREYERFLGEYLISHRFTKDYLEFVDNEIAAWAEVYL